MHVISCTVRSALEIHTVVWFAAEIFLRFFFPVTIVRPWQKRHSIVIASIQIKCKLANRLKEDGTREDKKTSTQLKQRFVGICLLRPEMCISSPPHKLK